MSSIKDVQQVGKCQHQTTNWPDKNTRNALKRRVWSLRSGGTGTLMWQRYKGKTQSLNRKQGYAFYTTGNNGSSVIVREFCGYQNSFGWCSTFTFPKNFRNFNFKLKKKHFDFEWYLCSLEDDWPFCFHVG